MKTQTFKFKDYIGSVEADIENEILFGKILFIDDVVTYEATDLPKLKIEFGAAVDDYLETCEQLDREPQKAYKGTFNVRIGETLHREAVKEAYKINKNLNEFCKEAISQRIQNIKHRTLKKALEVQINLIAPRKQEAEDTEEFFSKFVEFSNGKTDDPPNSNNFH